MEENNTYFRITAKFAWGIALAAMALPNAFAWGKYPGGLFGSVALTAVLTLTAVSPVVCAYMMCAKDFRTLRAFRSKGR